MEQIKITTCLIAILMISCSPSDQSGRDISAEYGYTPSSHAYQNEGWERKAKEMVEDQLQARGITDSQLLAAMEKTPRHLFVPPAYRKYAYNDSPLPIGKGQTISQPYVVALMTEMLQLEGEEKVLEIGTGSGYQAAILAQLAGEIYTIEVVESLADSSKAMLNRMGYDNIRVKWGDGYQGWPKHAPFDRIILTAAPDKVPPKLVEQLKPGGIMVLPEGSRMQELKIITKKEDGSIKERKEGYVRFVPMVHPDDTSFNKDN